MNKKTVSIILSIVLLVAFFLPFISIVDIFSASGFNVVFGKDGMSGVVNGGKFLFVSLLIPLGAIIVLFDSLGSGSSSVDYGYWMPLTGIIILSVIMYTGMSSGAGSGFSVGDFLKVMGYGYWITLAASVVLLINKGRSDF
jgi:hypothetical protein